MLHHAYLIKGWLLDKDPPMEIAEAVQAIIAAADRSELTLTFTKSAPVLHEMATETPELEPDRAAMPESAPSPTSVVTTSDNESAEPAKRKRKPPEYTPEEKVAIGARLKAAREAKAATRASQVPHTDDGNTPASPAPAKPYAPASAEKLIQDHNAYAGKRDPGQPLTDEDWPDIKARLAKNHSRNAIAGDYDQDPEDLDHFITSCQRREARSTGEAPVPLSGKAAGAPRQTW